MINTQQRTKLPSWTTFSLKNLENGVNHSAAVLMGDYLIILVQDYSYDKEHQGSDYDSDTHEPATLLAVDLRDNTIQEADLRGCESMFYYIGEYSFTKYKDNQIIKFGGELNDGTIDTMIRITIKSFTCIPSCKKVPILIYNKAFSVKCEKIKSTSSKQPRLRGHTAEIYNDCLYVYGGRNKDYFRGPQSDLWCFDLNDLTWRLCKPAGEAPGSLQKPSSFVFQDHLYIYGGESKQENGPNGKDIFKLNLKLMIWQKLKQQETFLMNRLTFGGTSLNGNIYKDHLIILGDSRSNDERLCCWNINANSWSTFDITKTGISRRTSNLIVYKDLLLVSGEGSEGLQMSILSLDQIKLAGPESLELKQLKVLFMNEEGSDVKFKVQEKTFPAHKEILIQRSKYFENLFKSGMAESRQDVIEITDCDSIVFQEFLRFLYCDKVQLDANLAIKLFAFSDKYLQEDLNERCLSFLRHNIDSENVYTILDFARQENLSHVKNWCMKFFKNNITVHNISGLVEYLNKQNNPEFAQDNAELRDKALSFITKNFVEISKCQDPNTKMKFYEDFLARNTSIETIVVLANFLSKKSSEKPGSGGYSENDGQAFEEETKELRDVVFEFARENMKMLRAKKTANEFSKTFLVDLVVYGVDKSAKD